MKNNRILNLITRKFPNLNKDQLEAITHTDGPLLIIAGPGTGKTHVIALRTVYLLLSNLAEPSGIMITTFTEKAAYELRDRINQIYRELSKEVENPVKLTDMIIGTIHSICSNFIEKYITYTPLKNNFVVLDDITRNLFIYEHFNEIVEKDEETEKYFGRWKSKWETIRILGMYFDKITEELITPDDLIASEEPFIKNLGIAYKKYESLLYVNNKVDFAHLQKIFLELLSIPSILNSIKSRIKYIMVDEYQDTNYIQEQILLKLVEDHKNLCVVGDEDQALYRFRGATVRNILEFPKHFKESKIVKLSINYRSHPKIIDTYNEFISSFNWEFENKKFRFTDKKIFPNKAENFEDYSSVLVIHGKDEIDEAEKVADLIEFLKQNKVIKDYSDVAILLRSVRDPYSKHYIKALSDKGIPYFAPRAKRFFNNVEVQLTLAIYAIIFNYISNEDVIQKYHDGLLQKGIETLGKYINKPISRFIKESYDEIWSLKKSETLDKNVLDYLYRMLSYEPFLSYLNDEAKARNLSILTKLLKSYQLYYGVDVITYKNREYIKNTLFNSFFNFIISEGLDEYEDPDNPLPKGYVQIMTIHQSKGLEFPVVIVGLPEPTQKRATKFIDRDLEQFYKRPPFEPPSEIATFDWARLFYVALSRPKNLLVLSRKWTVDETFKNILEGKLQWPAIQKDILSSQKFRTKNIYIPKKSFSLTAHINIYEVCPLQYKFYRYYEFEPSRMGQIVFGVLVHQTIEDIHKRVMYSNEKNITMEKIEEILKENYRSLLALGYRPISKFHLNEALEQVRSYYVQNQDIIEKIVETEVDVSYEKEEYIISGKIDLLIGDDGKLKILDFKTQKKPSNLNDPLISNVINQLHLYGYILEKKYGKTPEKLVVYWTSEKDKRKAIMEFEYDHTRVNKVIEYFDSIVEKILAKDFNLNSKKIDPSICKDCDFRFYCKSIGLIQYKD